MKKISVRQLVSWCAIAAALQKLVVTAKQVNFPLDREARRSSVLLDRISSSSGERMPHVLVTLMTLVWLSSGNWLAGISHSLGINSEQCQPRIQ